MTGGLVELVVVVGCWPPGEVVVVDVPPPGGLVTGGLVPRDGLASQVLTCRPTVNDARPCGCRGSLKPDGRVPT